MTEIVLVHGIDQQQKSADLLESEWLPALAGGVRKAGFTHVADRLWRGASQPGSIECRMAFYGNLFIAVNQQGNDDPGELTPDQAAFAAELALQWLKHAADRATKESTRRTSIREFAYVTGKLGIEQGSGTLVRTAIASLARISWFAPFGMGSHALGEGLGNR